MAEASDKVNIDKDMETDDNSVKTDDVFIDANDKPCVKPRRKRARESNDTSTGSNSSTLEHAAAEHEGGVVGESEEEEVYEGKDDSHVPGSPRITTSEQYFLKEIRVLKNDMQTLKTEKKSFDIKVKTIVTEIVANIKKKWMGEVVDMVKKEMLHVDNIERSVFDLEKSLKSVTDRNHVSGVFPGDSEDHVIDRVTNVEHKVVDLEARSRRNNLVFHGVHESPDEECMHVAWDLFDRGCHVDKHVTIERAHRIGERKRGTKNRPLIVKFLNYQDKVLVQRGRKHLPKEISMSDDLPQQIRMARKELVSQMMDEKRAGHDAWIKYPATLVVNGETVRTEPIQPMAPPVDRHTPSTNTNNRRDYCVNNDNEEQTIPHIPWSTAGSRGKHRHIPERKLNDRPNTRDTRDNFDDTQNTQRSRNNNSNYNNNNSADRGQPLWIRDANRQQGRRNNTQPDRSSRREHRDNREDRQTNTRHNNNTQPDRSSRREHRDNRDYRQTYTRHNNNNNIPVRITEEREEGEWSDGSQTDDERRDFDDHNSHGDFGRDTGASTRNYRNTGGQRYRRGETSRNEDRQGYYNRRM